jgi:prepilin signal peptidase PulO-like enzyme (type II secretory pathway)
MYGALLGVAFFVFGAIVGSFLNVLILRRGVFTLGGRSMCLSCSSPLKWYDLVPIGSFILLRGRCRKCAAKISYQYPIVEILSGLTFLMLYLRSLAPLAFAISLVFWLSLLCIAAYDFRHTIIPDEFVFAAIAAGFFSLFVTSTDALVLPSILQILTGFGLAFFFFAFWFLSEGRLMGLGDSKLALAIGWFLAPGTALTALFVSFWAGAFAGVALMAFSRLHRLSGTGNGHTLKSEIPMAPFLVFGAALVYFGSISLFS